MKPTSAAVGSEHWRINQNGYKALESTCGILFPLKDGPTDYVARRSWTESNNVSNTSTSCCGKSLPSSAFAVAEYLSSSNGVSITL